jgi:hypothetical protein
MCKVTQALVLCIASIAFFEGCASHRAQPAPVQGSPFELVSRFRAAAAINDVATRDQALAQVAWLGAENDDGTTVLNCLDAMSDSPVRDSTGYQCALRLAEDGAVPQATAVAQAIHDSTVRDRALSKIAETSPYPLAPP